MNMPTKEQLEEDASIVINPSVEALLRAIADGRLVVCECTALPYEWNGEIHDVYAPATTIPEPA